RLRRREVEADFAHRRDDLRVNALAGLGAGGRRAGPLRVGEGVEEGGRHLRAARRVDAREDHRDAHGCSAGMSHREKAVAAPAPASWETTNPGTSAGRIPANVSVAERASVTAGFAKEVEAVNQ